MKKYPIIALFLSLLLVNSFPMSAQWSIAGDKITTGWAEQVNPENPLPEYPRPSMVRERWQSLNGLWDYSIEPLSAGSANAPQGKILVPFAIESALSGVGRTVGAEKALWYSRTFTVPSKWAGSRIILHFGAVDWKADVWVNGIKAGSHTGGYSPFEMDITDALIKGENSLTVRVWDPTDKGFQPRGKQVSNPKSIWYTSVTGIWQTVWMEPVPEKHISSISATPDLERGVLNVDTKVCGSKSGIIEVKVMENGRTVASGRALCGERIEVAIAEPKLWSPDHPFLYDMEVTLSEAGRSIDKVSSYAAMRSISCGRDKDGILRMRLNGKDLFQFGPLDQGWWPDGLYTAPTDEALAFDIIKTKELGFNMIRKHVKVEPERWYYHCDRLGMLVWQDMPSGERFTNWDMTNYWSGEERTRSVESEANFRAEWREIIDNLRHHPSIVVWVPFNEGWGQFKTKEITEWTKYYDPSRLVNSASGGNHFLGTGDILDLHHYPQPEMYLYDAKRVTVLGEYGGIGWPIEGHLWVTDRNWGYIKFNSAEEVTEEYVKYAEMLLEMIPRGFSAAIYTQTTDVEMEVNGLMTYDRKIVKPVTERIKEINGRICRSLEKR